MKNIVKQLIIIFIVLSLQKLTLAKSISEGMNAMWNKTTGSTKVTNDNYGATLGGMSMRSPVRSFDIVAFDPPRLSAGCGGIDAYFGSFSMISENNIKNLIRAIMSNASGYAVKIALDNLCPPCQNIMSGLQDLVTKINSQAKNSCQLGTDAVNILTGKGNLSAFNNGKAQIESVTAAAEGHFKDLAAANENIHNHGINANRLQNSTNKSTEYGNNIVNTLISAGILDNIDTSVFGGDQEFLEIAMNLYGTQIVLTNTKSDDTQGNFVSSSKQRIDKILPPIWTLNDIIYGKVKNVNLNSYKCKDFNIYNADSCQTIIYYNSKFIGTYKYILKLLLNKESLSDNEEVGSIIEDNSLISNLRHDKKLSINQQKFFNSLPTSTSDILKYVATSTNDKNVIAVADYVAKMLGEQMAAEIILTMNKIIKIAYSKNIDNSGKVIVPLSKSQEKQLQILENETNNILNNNNVSLAQQNLIILVDTIKLLLEKEKNQ